MSTYLWRGRNKRGEPVSGQLEGLTESAIAEQLMAIGVAPVLIEPAIAKVDTTNALPAWLERWSRTPIVIEDMLFFTRQLYTLNKAGVPILRAFAGLQASATKPAMVDLCIDIRSSLDQGRELSVALGSITRTAPAKSSVPRLATCLSSRTAKSSTVSTRSQERSSVQTVCSA